MPNRKVVKSTVNSSLDTGSGFGFRNWHYVTAGIKLSENGATEQVCLDTGCSLTLIDRAFLMEHLPGIKIRTMAVPINVRGIGSDKHATAEYVILPIYLPGESKEGPADAFFEREAHIVEGLKAKMLLGVDIMGPEGIDVSISKRKAYINSCKVEIPIRVKPHPPQTRVVHAKTPKVGLVIPPFSSATIPVHYASLPDNRDFLFEPSSDSSLSLYAHLVDAGLTTILARNDTAQAIQVPRNLRLGAITEIDYDNCYHVTEDTSDVSELAVRHNSKPGWFKKALTCVSALLAATGPVASAKPSAISDVSTSSRSSIPLGHEVTLPNGVNIYARDDEHIEAFTNLVEEFPKLWQDADFVNLPQSEWMRIPLRSDWESRVSGKAKVYLLGLKDREVVDRTFDELQEQGRLCWTASSTPFSYPVFIVWKTVNGQRKGRVVVDI